MDRRRFLTVLGATGGAAAAASACDIHAEPTEHLVPYVVPPENQVPGIATYYATTCRECAAGCGLHAKVREGRVIKLEGNPDSPVNQGRLCSRGQAALQGLYNPDRVTDPMARGPNGVWQTLSWDDAIARLKTKVREARGKGIACVTGLENGSFGELVDDWMKEVGGRHVTYEPFAFEALREGNRIAFGTAAIPWYDFASARYIASFGADFMETWLSPVGYQNGFTRAHAFESGRDGSMAKFVFVGPRLGLTAMSADEWIAARPGTEGVLALAMAHEILRNRLAPAPADAVRLRELLASYTAEQAARVVGIDAAEITRLAREFAESKGGLAVAGGIAAQYPIGAQIVAAVNILNYVAGQVGKTVKFGPNHELEAAGSFKLLTDLVAEMKGGKVGLLLVHGANPAHSLPAAFSEALGHVGYKVSFSAYLDETAAASDLVLPDLHPLEQWNDSRPHTGVYAVQQPVMQPVFPNTRHAADVILLAAGKSGTFKDYVQTRWRTLHERYGGGRGFDDFWNDALQHGGVYVDVPGHAVRLAPDASKLPELGAAVALVPGWPAAKQGLIVFPSIGLHDGRGANKPWLQELPDPVSKITWHGWVEVHPQTAATWQVANGDVVLLKSDYGAVRAPVWITPGIRPDVLAIPTGQGHKAYGRYAKDRSFNAFELLSPEPADFGGRAFSVGVTATKTGDHRRLATTEGDAREQGRGVIEVLPLAKARELKRGTHPFAERETPAYADQALRAWAEAQHEKASLGNYAGEHPRWAMAIDLAKCTGCSACVTACYAENNLATVGEELVTRRRQMSWMRIERYYTGGEGDRRVGAVVTPMLCQQCGNAPCEPVCPVYAAYHTPDGLNGQVYNRCVGTRYCANNCPYKVRYFNWYNYAEPGGEWESWPEPLNMLLNPDVTVREKGVMEKCTFCVQRIRGAQNRARLEDRSVQDGDITPSCAQACPSEAIVFGDLHDKTSRVAALAQDPRGYHVLAGLNTQSGITYLARVVHAGAREA
ncbi:MAG TPA: molybdopterin-dependent oxidoreductase [Gemmatimonadales bacterium]|nr:molybdopterin-dependent oxidoreductase [Gemmatimonadales bacterium]